MSSIRLYHGTASKFSRPNLSVQRGKTDFGAAFYMSESIQDAQDRAFIKAKHAESEVAYTYSVKIDISDMKKQLDVLDIQDDMQWLDYVIKNRGGRGVNFDYDAVIGKTADASRKEIQSAVKELRLDIAPYVVKLDWINRLKINRLNIQYAFKTEKAIDYICAAGITVVKYDIIGGRLINARWD